MVKRELAQELFQLQYKMSRMELWDVLNMMPKSEFFLLQLLYLYKQECDNQLLTHSQLAEKLKLSNPAISRTVKQLVAKDWLVRQSDEEDRRNSYLKLTALGQEAYLEAKEKMDLFVDRSLGQFETQEITHYIETGYRIYNVMQEAVASINQEESSTN